VVGAKTIIAAEEFSIEFAVKANVIVAVVLVMEVR